MSVSTPEVKQNNYLINQPCLALKHFDLAPRLGRKQIWHAIYKEVKLVYGPNLASYLKDVRKQSYLPWNYYVWKIVSKKIMNKFHRKIRQAAYIK